MLKYTITVSNAGPSDAKNILVRDSLPENLIFVSASHNGTYGNGFVLWNLPVIKANQLFELELKVKVIPDLVNGTEIINRAIVTYDSTDIPSDPEITPVITVSDLEITKISNPKPVQAML